MPGFLAQRWLWLEALLPLFGPSVLYIAWGAARWTVASRGSAFNYKWGEAMDTMSWLYGAAILAVQGGVRSLKPEQMFVAFFCFGAAFMCALLLLAAMTNRAEKADWKPPRSLEVVSLGLTIAIIFAAIPGAG